MSKSTSFLYQLARAANDIEKLTSGNPKRIGFAAKENSDLPLDFINDLLQAKTEKESGLAKPFKI